VDRGGDATADDLRTADDSRRGLDIEAARLFGALLRERL
jgi:hypothetical protein